MENDNAYRFGEMSRFSTVEMEYQQRVQRLQTYVPFLKKMIEHLEGVKDRNREAQLMKMRSLLNILTDSNKKLRLETIHRCEEVLQKLYSKVEGAFEWSSGSTDEPTKLCLDMDRFSAGRYYMKNYSGDPDSPLLESSDSLGRDGDGGNPWRRRSDFEETPRSPSPPASVDVINIPKPVTIPMERRDPIPNPIIIPLERKKEPVIIPLQRREESLVSKPVIIPLERKEDFESKWYEDVKLPEPITMRSNYGVLNSPPSDPGINPYCSFMQPIKVSHDSPPPKSLKRSDIPKLEEMRLNRKREEYLSFETNTHTSAHERWPQEYGRRPSRESDSSFEGRRTPSTMLRPGGSPRCTGSAMLFDYDHGQYSPHTDPPENAKEPSVERESEKPVPKTPTCQRASIREKLALEINKVHRVGVSTGGALRTLSKDLTSPPLQRTMHGIDPFTRRISGGMDDEPSKSISPEKGKKGERDKSLPDKPSSESSSLLGQDTDVNKSEGKDENHSNSEDNSVLEEFSFKKQHMEKVLAKQRSGQSSNAVEDRVPAISKSPEDDDEHSSAMSICDDDSDNGTKIPFLDTVHELETPVASSPIHSDPRISSQHISPCNSSPILPPFINPSMSNIPQGNQEAIPQRNWSAQTAGNNRGYPPCYQANMVHQRVSSPPTAPVQLMQLKVTPPAHLVQPSLGSPSQTPVNDPPHGLQSHFMGLGDNYAHVPLANTLPHRRPPLLPAPTHTFRQGQMPENGHNWSQIQNNQKAGLLPHPTSRQSWSYSRHNISQSVPESRHAPSNSPDIRSHCGRGGSWNARRGSYVKVNDPRLRNKVPSRPPDNKYQWKHPADPRRASPVAQETKRPLRELQEEKEEVSSPLDFLYVTEEAPKTGKGYGFQKFRIPKLKNREPKKEEQISIASSTPQVVIPAPKDEKSVVEEQPKVETEEIKEKEEAVPKSKEELTKELFETLLKVSLSSTEGTKILENSKFIEELREKLNLNRPKKSRPIIVSDSESEEEEKPIKPTETGKKKSWRIIQSSESESSAEEKEDPKTPPKPLENKRPTRSCRAVKQQSIVEVFGGRPRTRSQRKLFTVRDEDSKEDSANDANKKGDDSDDESDEGEDDNVFQDAGKEETRNEVVEEEVKTKPPARRTKRRSSLELLQEDIREMFICEGVMSANGLRMCRLLKEAAAVSNPIEESSFENELSKDSDDWEEKSDSSVKDGKVSDNSDDSADDADVKKTNSKKGKTGSSSALQPKVCLKKTNSISDLSEGNQTSRRGRNCARRSRRKPLNAGNRGPSGALSSVKCIAEDSERESENDFESEIKPKEDKEVSLSKDEDIDSEKNKEPMDSIEPKCNVGLKTSKVELSVTEENNLVNMDLKEDEQTESQEVKAVITTDDSKDFQTDALSVDQEVEEKVMNTAVSSKGKDDENGDIIDKKSQKNKKKANRKLVNLSLKKVNLENKMLENSSNVSAPNTESYSSKNSFKITKDTDLVDISYYSNGVDAIPCKLCSYNGKQIVGHYITKHPESEILVSRLSEEQAKIAWNWNENHKGPIRFSQEHSNSFGPFVCLICETFHNGFVNFFDHVTTHTGEYRYNCKYCSYRSFKDNNVRSHAYYVHQKKWSDISFAVTPIDEIVKTREIDSSGNSTVVTPGLLAHLCSKCNYVQISENQVEKHIATFHKDGEIAKVLKIDLSLIAPEPTSVSIPDDTSEMDELSQDTSVSQGTSVSQENSDSQRVSVVAMDTENNLKEKSSSSCGQDNEIDDKIRETRTEEVLKSMKQEKVDPEEHCAVNANLDEKVFIIDNEASEDPRLFDKSKEVWDEVLEYPEFDEEIKIVALKLNVRLEDDESKDTEFSVLDVKKEVVEEDVEKEDVGNVKEVNVNDGVKVGVEVKDKEKSEDERKEECKSQVAKGETAEGSQLSTNVHHTVDIEVIDIDDDSDEKSDSDYSSDSDSSSDDDEMDCKIISELPGKDNLFTLDMIPEVKVVTKIADITNKVADQIKQKKIEDQNSMIKEPEEDDINSKTKVDDGDQKMEIDIPPENRESEEKNPEVESPPKFKIRVRNLSGDRLSSNKKSAAESNTSEADPYIDVIGNSPIFEPDADNTLCQISSVCSLHPNEQVPEDFIKAVSENETPDLKQLAAYDTSPSSGSVYYIAPPHFPSLPTTDSFHVTGIGIPVLNSQRLYPYPASSGMSPPGFRKILPAPVVNPPVSPLVPQAFPENPQLSGATKSSAFQEQNYSQNGKGSRNEGVSSWTNLSGESSVVSPVSNQTKVCSIMRASLYAKASKTPAVFNQVLNNQMKLCHLFKCMGRQCSFTTDEPVVFLSHYLGHESLETGAASSTGPSSEGEVEKQERKFDWQQCCYCAEMFSSGSAFVKHVQSEHGECIFQCPYCFYRAAAVSYVILHQNSTHITEKVSVMHCEAPGKCKKEAPPIKPNIEAYVCYQGNCKRSFYSPSKYLSHLQIEHSAVSIYCCHKCSYQCLKADRLLQHYKLHSFYLYQCVYCEQGSDTSEEILQHLASFHPNKRATVCKRNSQMTSNGSARTSGRHVYILYEDIELTEMDDVDVVPAGSSGVVGSSAFQAEEVQKTNNNSNESQKESEDGNSDDDNLIIAEDAEETPVKVNLQRLEDESEIVELSGSDMDEDIPVIDSDKLMDSRADDSMEGQSDMNLLNSQLEISQDQQEVDTSQMSDLHVVFTHSNAEELEMLDNSKDTDVAQGQKDSSNNDDIIEVDGDKEMCDSEKPPKVDGVPKGVERERDKRLRRARVEQKAKEDYSSAHSNKKNMSSKESANNKIDRPNLYICCFPGCSYLAKDVFQLKHHVRDCPQGKDCHNFACPHCNRAYKHLPYLLKHYRVHGKKVFVCMVCKYQGSYTNTAIQHVKARHRATSTTVSPLIDWQEPDDIPVNTKDQKLIVVAPKDVSQSFLLRKRFLPEDADYLPFPCVYNRDAKCARCSYSTKIRSNMRRHLHLHLRFSQDLLGRMTLSDISDPNQVPWSVKDIVNPMPCLETKEMMFDKMTNWAISSHLDDNIKEEEMNEGRRDSVASNYEEDNFIPRFVPENERYVCGVIGCHYQTVDDTMLRHHLRALHREETFFRCAHCPDDPKLVHQVPVDRLAAHLKMHDDRLYQCIHCNYYHFQRRFVERHIMDKHTEMSQMVNVIREPETVIKLPSSSGTSGMAGTSANGSIRSSNPSQGDGGVEEDNLWHCSLCSYSCTNRESISDHARISHSICSQYICGMCPFRSAYLSSFNPHFSIKHLGYPVQLIANYFRHNISAFASPSITIILPNGKVIHPPNPMSSKSDPRSEPVIEVWPYVEKGFGKSPSSSVRLKELNTTYPWQRCMPRVRYLRGIPIAEEGEEIMYDLAESLKLNDDKEGDDGSPFIEVCDEKSTPQEMILDEVQIVEVEESDLTVLDHTSDKEVRLSLKRRKSDADSSSSEATLSESKRKIDQGKATDLAKSVASKKPLPEDQPAPAKVLKIMSPEARVSKEVAINPEEEKISLLSSKENNLKIKRIVDNEDLNDLKKQFGDFGSPIGSFFVCPKCKHKSKNKSDMRDHLFRELNYKRYVCTHCGLMAPARSNLQKHYSRVHQKDGKPEAIATLPPDKNIELWVHHILAAQLSVIKQFQSNVQTNESDGLDEPETASEAKSSSFKTPSGEGACKVFYSCKFCSAKFTTIRGLKVHAKNYHFKMGSWICGHCDVTANNQVIISKHNKFSHPDKEELVISNTLGAFMTNKFWEECGLLAHMGFESGEAALSNPQCSIFKCSSCNYQTNKLDDIEQHKLKHSTLKGGKSEFGAGEDCIKTSDTPNQSQVDSEKAKMRMNEKDNCTNEGFTGQESSENTINDVELLDEAFLDEDVLITMENKSEYGKSSPLYVFKCYYCRMKSPSCDEVFNHWEYVHHKPASGVRRLRLFKCRRLSIVNQENCNPQKYHCAYCGVDGSLLQLKEHCSAKHSDCDFKVGNVNNTAFYCLICSYFCNSSATLSSHFENVHPGQKPLYEVKNIENNKTGAVSSLEAGKLLDDKDEKLREEEFLKSTLYRCYWCNEEFPGLKFVKVHHNKKHASFPLKYLIEMKPTGNIDILEKRETAEAVFHCPSCSFSSKSYPIIFNHLRGHQLPFKCGNCEFKAEFPSKISEHHLREHPLISCPTIHSDVSAEFELSKLWKQVKQIAGSESTAPVLKRPASSPLASEPKKLCAVARKSTTCISPTVQKATARKSTNPSASFIKNLKNLKESSSDEECTSDESLPSEEMPTGSYMEVVSPLEEFSYYNGGNGKIKSSVDLSQITVWMTFGGCAAKRVQVSKMAQLVDLSPQLILKDIGLRLKD